VSPVRIPAAALALARSHGWKWVAIVKGEVVAYGKRRKDIHEDWRPYAVRVPDVSLDRVRRPWGPVDLVEQLEAAALLPADP